MGNPALAVAFRSGRYLVSLVEHGPTVAFSPGQLVTLATSVSGRIQAAPAPGRGSASDRATFQRMDASGFGGSPAAT